MKRCEKYEVALSEYELKIFQTSRMINSHGGPVMTRPAEQCSSPAPHQQQHLRLLEETFPGCSSLMGHCGLSRNDTKAIRQYGVCLNSK